MIQAGSDSGNAAALVFFLFDLLYLDGEDVSVRPADRAQGAARRLAGERRAAPALQRL
jgi:ATP-dependent DNA ligase